MDELRPHSLLASRPRSGCAAVPRLNGPPKKYEATNALVERRFAIDDYALTAGTTNTSPPTRTNNPPREFAGKHPALTIGTATPQNLEINCEFVDCTEPDQVAVLTALDAAHEEWFARLKYLTVYGYCTSEVGAGAELHYEVIPGSYDGCTELGRWRAAPGDS